MAAAAQAPAAAKVVVSTSPRAGGGGGGGGDRKVVPVVVAAAAGDEAQSEMHVLAVDDSSVDRAVISGILRSSQFRGELLALLLLYHILSILVLLLTCACV